MVTAQEFLSKYKPEEAAAPSSAADFLSSYQQPEPSFIDDTASDLMQRGRNIGESFEATSFGLRPEQGEQSVAEFLAQAGGQVIGGAGDVLGNLAMSGYREFVPEGAQEAISEGLESFGESTAGRYLGELAGEAVDWYDSQSPRAQRNLSALGNIASVVPFGKTTSAAGKGLQQVSKQFKSKVDDIIRTADKMDSKSLKAASNAAYKQAADLGGAFSPDLTKQIVEESTKEFIDVTPTVKKFSAPLKGKLGGEYVDDALQAFKNIQDDAVSLQDFDTIDKTLTDFLTKPDLSDQFGRLNDAGQKIKGMQQKLREKALSATSKDVVGDANGFEALAKARELWSKQLKMRDIEEMIGRALNTKQPNSSLKKYFGNLLNKVETGGKTAFKYTPDEIKAMRKVAESGKIDEFLNLFGSRLPSSVMAGTGDFVTATALRGASELPRNLATKAQLGRTQELLDVIAGQAPNQGRRNLARGALRSGLNLPANALGTLGTLTRARAPQMTTLGLINQEETQQ
ncbi:MAG: hypothetical protein Unbinned5081contig1002_44 [Prokaryotic dsDNA virus sp.]|nr:MAG: hypothetical protein Unbinned5081contig1002_44 [Prokaryotic dsDNA virus sp.]|tara:strand:+ start:25078 stop:26619 length:1542 start_codon:yes stop_codon:yes gene_type:complete